MKQRKTILQRFFAWASGLFKRSGNYTQMQLVKLFSGLNASETASETEALSAAALWNGLHLIGSAVAKVEKHVKQEVSPDVIEERPGHRLNRLLMRPNPFTTPFEFFEAMAAYCALYGNAYAWIRRDGNSIPVEIWMVHPSTVTIEYYPSRGTALYSFILHNQIFTVPSVDVIHIKKMAWEDDNLKGANGLFYHGGTIKAALYPKRAANSFYANGAHIPGFLGTDLPLSQEDAEAISEAFSTSTGVDNAGVTPVLHSGIKYYPIKMSPKEAAFVEISKYSVEEISRFLGIPLHMLSELSRSSFSNIEQQARDFFDNIVVPYAMRFQEELSYKLLTTREFFSGYRIDFNTSPISQADTASLADFIRTGFSVGALSPNDIRRMSGRNPREDEYGDKYFVPLNMTSDPDNKEEEAQNDSDDGNQDIQSSGTEGQEEDGGRPAEQDN